MKLNRIVTIAYLLLGLIGLLTMVSFTVFDNCSVATTNINFIKDQTKLALETPDFQVSKYHAFKALNGIWSAKNSFEQCGCEDVVANMEQASANLKEATKTLNHDDSKVFLKIAMQNALSSISAIEVFEKKVENEFIGTKPDPLADNSKKDAKIDFQTDKIEQALEKFETSLNNVVEIDDCDRAFQFVRAMQDDTKAKLMNKDVSQRKHYYLTRVIQITESALLRLGKDCMPPASFAGK